MTKLISEMTPQELDCFLMKKYSIGLHLFAVILWQVLATGDFTRFESYPSSEICFDLRRKLIGLKNKILNIEAELDEILLNENDKKRLLKNDRDEAEKVVAEEYQLKYYFDHINQLIMGLTIAASVKRRGAPFKKRNLITTLWSLLVYKQNKRIEWDLIADIIDWFWEKLKCFKIYFDLIPIGGMSYPYYIKGVYYRNKDKVRDLLNEIQERYFRNDYTKADGIVFLGKNKFLLQHNSLMSPYNDYLNIDPEEIPIFNEILLNEINPARFHSHNLVRSATYYIATLCKKKPKAYPKIIFPDLSFLD